MELTDSTAGVMRQVPLTPSSIKSPTSSSSHPPIDSSSYIPSPHHTSSSSSSSSSPPLTRTTTPTPTPPYLSISFIPDHRDANNLLLPNSFPTPSPSPPITTKPDSSSPNPSSPPSPPIITTSHWAISTPSPSPITTTAPQSPTAEAPDRPAVCPCPCPVEASGQGGTGQPLLRPGLVHTQPQVTRNLRHRSNRRPVHERLRQKRQTLQDMARPLKHWLYRHRNNPYPSKGEKETLAASSHMSLTQVSNWFANARRRLKNTVNEPELSWKKRIKLYNSRVEGNAERLSICSDDSEDEGVEEDETADEQVDTERNSTWLTGQSVDGGTGETQADRREEKMDEGHNQVQDMRSDETVAGEEEEDEEDEEEEELDDDDEEEDDNFKSSILHRYLSDTYQQTINLNGQKDCEGKRQKRKRRRKASGSLTSHDCSSYSSCPPSPLDGDESWEIVARQWQTIAPCGEMDFKEISAALALTNLWRSASSLRISIPKH